MNTQTLHLTRLAWLIIGASMAGAVYAMGLIYLITYIYEGLSK